jgi:response regulator RpfG family c-di-GMP phosphodiesterase
MLDNGWLAEQLKANGLVTQAQIDEASRSGSGELCRDLISTGVIQEPHLLRFLGLHFQTRYVSTEKLSSAKIVQWVLDLLPIEFCEQNHVLPVRCDKQRNTLSVVTPDPSDAQLLDETKRTAKVQEVRAYVALPHSIEAGIRKFYRGDLHAFARMDDSLRQNYSELLNIYEQRLIDFDSDGAEPQLPDNGAPVETFRHDELVLGAGSQEMPAAEPPSRPRPPSVETPAVAPPSFVRPSRPESLLRVIEAVVNQLEQGQGWRTQHSFEVARLATLLASRAGLQPEATSDLHLSALLHELGKPVDTHLTLLTLDAVPALRARAQESARTAAKLVGAGQLPADVEETLAALYERYDSGAIPLSARLLQAADAYCDLVSNPNAPGGRCPSPEAAVHRLYEAAQRGLLDPTAVQQLSNVKSGTATDQAGRPLVLIIDEDARSAALLEGQLKSAGFDAIVANTTGDAALALLGENVSLVLSEVELKPMDGFAFLEWLRSNKRTSTIPFMFVSSRAGVEDVNRGFELGAVDYVVKPFRPEVVLAKIRRLVPTP